MTCKPVEVVHTCRCPRTNVPLQTPQASVSGPKAELKFVVLLKGRETV